MLLLIFSISTISALMASYTKSTCISVQLNALSLCASLMVKSNSLPFHL